MDYAPKFVCSSTIKSKQSIHKCQQHLIIVNGPSLSSSAKGLICASFSKDQSKQSNKVSVASSSVLQ